MDVDEVRVDELVGPAMARILARRGYGREAAPFMRRAAEEGQDEVMMGLLRDFQPEWARAFSRVNKVVPTPGTQKPVVMPRIDGLEYSRLEDAGPEGRRAVEQSREAELRVIAGRARRGRDRKKKVYKLYDFFSDDAVIRKFEVPGPVMQLVKRTAVIDPGAASRNLEAHLRKVGFDCAVIPGDYAKGRKTSRSRLHEAVTNSRIAAPDVDLVCIGESVTCLGPRDERGRLVWQAAGTVRNSPEVIAVSRLALLHGPETVRTLFEEDMIRCGVLLDTGCLVVSPLEYHYGGQVPSTDGYGGSDGVMYSDEVRGAAKRVVPLMQSGKVVASAVRASDTVAYANWHVLETGVASAPLTIPLPGEPCAVVSTSHELAPDVWAVEHATAPLDDGAWVTREADVDEKAVYVYHGTHGPEFSDVISVVRKEAGTVVTTRPAQARRGVSGAALVALSDGALLGVYRGASYDLCSCAVVSSTPRAMHADLLPLPEPDTLAKTAFDKFVSRGLYPELQQALAAMQPVYAGDRHMGYSVRHGGASYTTIDCDVWDLSSAFGRSLGFERADGGRFRSDPDSQQVSLRYVRLPRLGERVYVMGNDGDGVYLSAGMAVARFASDRRGFWLSGDPASGSTENFVYAGALIVADSDGAVLGQFADAMPTANGMMSKCAGFMERAAAAPVTRERVLNNSVPGAMVELWEPEVVRALVERDEAVVARYAIMGQSVIQSAVMVEFGRLGYATDMASAISVVSDTNWVSSRAYDCGFHTAVRPVSGVGVARPAERLADAFRAFIGMLALWQGPDQVVNALHRLGWFDRDWGEDAARLAGPGRSPIAAQGPWASRTSSPTPSK